jgi:ribosomal protein S18 acetylase RimI-like enzyme
MLPRMVRTCTLSRMPRVLKVINALDKNHPREPDHYYLFMIGVHTDHQGQGLGSTILAKTLEAVDAEGMPAYLENSNPRNMPLYERHGFKVVKEVKFEPNGPSLWPMWREGKS